jgi:acylphosphatase
MTVEGRVQGVGYRVACCRVATELGLGGWVCNQPDGTVELEAEGSPQALTELQLWCEKGPSQARVNALRTTRLPVYGSDWFEIRG